MTAPVAMASFGDVCIVERSCRTLKPLKGPTSDGTPRGFPSAAQSIKTYSSRLQRGSSQTTTTATTTAAQKNASFATHPFGSGTQAIDDTPRLSADVLQILDSGSDDHNVEKTFRDALLATRSALAAHRAIGARSIARLCKHAQGRLLAAAGESPEVWYALPRLLSDSSKSVRTGAVEMMLALTSTDSDASLGDAKAAARLLNLLGAPCTEDDGDAAHSGSVVMHPVVEGIIGFPDGGSDPRPLLATHDAHRHVLSHLSYEDAEDALKRWSIISRISSNAETCNVVMEAPETEAAARRAFDALFLDGLVLTEIGLAIATELVDALRLGSAGRRSQTVKLFASFGDLIILLLSVLLSERGDVEMARECAISGFGFLSNCLRFGLWRDGLEDLLARGTKLGSLRALEAVVLVQPLRVPVSHFIRTAVVEWVTEHVGLTNSFEELKANKSLAIELATGLHLLSTWITASPVDALLAWGGGKTPIDAAIRIEQIVKQLCSPRAATSLIETLAGTDGALAMTLRGAVEHARIRFVAAAARCVPSSRKVASALIFSTLELLPATYLDAPKVHRQDYSRHMERSRAWLGPAVSALVEVLGFVKDHARDDDNYRSRTILPFSVSLLDILQRTELALDAVASVVLPMLMPVFSLQQSSSAEEAQTALIQLCTATNSSQNRAKLPWYAIPALDNDHAVVWARWFRWFLANISYARIPMQSSTEPAQVLLVLTSFFIRHRDAVVHDRHHEETVAVVAKTHLDDGKSPPPLLLHLVQPYVDQLCAAFDMDEASYAPCTVFTLFTLLSSGCSTEVKLALLAAWVGNRALCRETSALMKSVLQIDVFRQTWQGVSVADYVGRWTCDEAIRLVDVLAGPLRALPASGVGPLQSFLHAVVARARSEASAFEGGVISDLLKELGIPPSDGAAPGNMLDLFSVPISNTVNI